MPHIIDWEKEEKRFLNAVKLLKIPDGCLSGVKNIIVKSKNDIDEIENGGGCYWIWTNENVRHSLHNNHTPDKFDGGEIIYNGSTKNDIKSRIINHLYSTFEEGRSGISIDIYTKSSRSHRKRAMSIISRAKVPYFKKSAS